jgi:hypothetical protein
LNKAEQVKIAGYFPKIFKEEDSNRLSQPVTMEELKSVLCKFKKENIRGLDGWTSKFFTHFFDVVGQDLLNMVEEMRSLGSVGGNLNSTFFTLIPKANKPKTFDDFRPISLCNLCYKLNTKMISNRIKPFLSSTLSAEQVCFLHGRRIQEAIRTVHESLHSIKKKKLSALVLKLDLRKAYYCVDWDFLRLILISMGCGIQLTNWIMACVSSSTFAVLINGEVT